MWEEGDFSSLTMLAQKGNIVLEAQTQVVSINAEAFIKCCFGHEEAEKKL